MLIVGTGCGATEIFVMAKTQQPIGRTKILAKKIRLFHRVYLPCHSRSKHLGQDCPGHCCYPVSVQCARLLLYAWGVDELQACSYCPDTPEYPLAHIFHRALPATAAVLSLAFAFPLRTKNTGAHPIAPAPSSLSIQSCPF